MMNDDDVRWLKMSKRRPPILISEEEAEDLRRNKIRFKHLVALPSWGWALIYRRLFPASHPWSPKQLPKFFTLTNWCILRREFTKQFDLVMWVAIPCLIIMAIRWWSLK